MHRFVVAGWIARMTLRFAACRGMPVHGPFVSLDQCQELLDIEADAHPSENKLDTFKQSTKQCSSIWNVPCTVEPQ